MGTKRMGSQDVSGSRGISSSMPVCAGGSGSGGGIQEPKLQTLVRQGSSLYNLTLDEVQNHLGDLGKPISSMNIDELLKSVWNVEANQAAVGSIDYAAAVAAPSLTRDLCKKTVDEVWQDIQQEQRNIGLDLLNDRQLTLGEMTLEDFLVKAGVVAESSSGNLDPDPSLGIDTMQDIQQQQPQWMSYEVPPIHQQQTMLSVFIPGQSSQQASPIPLVTTPMVDASYPESQIGTLSDAQTPGRKRGGSSDVVVERTVERRQKRMIKNRESAARSRARKQAYTHELENKVSQLERENERLKRQKVLEKVLPCVPLPEPKYQLRRTSSARF